MNLAPRGQFTLYASHSSPRDHVNTGSERLIESEVWIKNKSWWSS